MKTFLAVLAAILVAAGIFYLINQDHETKAAHDALENEMRKHPISAYGLGNSDSLPKPPPAPPDKSLAWMIDALQIKTSDGPVTIPKGAVVRIVPDKSKPGIIKVNFNGYVASIRSDAITQNESR